MSSIADQYGFFWDTLWNHEKNAELRERRQNPNILHPGDHVFIPEVRAKEEAAETTRVHTFRLKGVPVRLNLRLLDEEGAPLAGMKYTLTVDGKQGAGLTSDDGMISEVIPPRARSGRLHLDTGEEYVLELGHVNPLDYVSGVQARLRNLGYYEGEGSGTLDDATSEAIRRFQSHHDLEESGQLDDATRQALLADHES